MAYKVGLIGAGAMGGAIGTRLLSEGCELFVFDLDKERVAELVAKGATSSSSAVDVAKASEFVIFSLNASKIVEIAAFGNGGAIEGADNQDYQSGFMWS